MYTLIGLAVLAIGAIAAAILSAKNWHWGQVTLVFLIFLAATGYGVLAADVLAKKTQTLQKRQEVETELARLTEENRALRFGTRDTGLANRLPAKLDEQSNRMLGVLDLQAQLNDLTQVRGTVWPGIFPTAGSRVNATTGAIDVSQRFQVQVPDPNAIDPQQPPPPAPTPLAGLGEGSIVYLFEEGPARDQQGANEYLGEFQVAGVAAGKATIEPVLRQSWVWPRDAGPADQKQLARLANSKGPWIMYDTMPVDSYAVFEGMDDQQLRDLLPADVVDEYIRHGSVADETVDPLSRAAFAGDGKALTDEQVQGANDVEWRYQRPVRDYGYLFQLLARQRIEKFAEYDALVTDIGHLKDVQTSANLLQENRRKEITVLQHDSAGVKKEVAAIEQYATATQQRLDQTQQQLQSTLQENLDLTSKLAQAQRAIAQQIEQTSSDEPAAF